jgi:hypothetical protein
VKHLRRDDGNVILELALAVMVFGTLLLPAVESIARVATAYRLADTASMTLARTWTVTETASRATVFAAARARLVQTSSLPMRITMSCVPSCDATATSVSVTTKVQSGVLGEIASTMTLGRDAYGQ